MATQEGELAVERASRAEQSLSEFGEREWGQCIGFSAAAEVERQAAETHINGETAAQTVQAPRKSRFFFLPFSRLSDGAVAPSQLRLHRGINMIGPSRGVRRSNPHNLRACGATTEGANGEMNT